MIKNFAKNPPETEYVFLWWVIDNKNSATAYTRASADFIRANPSEAAEEEGYTDFNHFSC